MEKLFLAGAAAVNVGYLFHSVFSPDHIPAANGSAYKELPKTPYSAHPNTHFLTKVPNKIGIIGAGISGLCTAKELIIQGYEIEILEKNSGLGGVWFKNYPEVGLQSYNNHYFFPDFRIPKEFGSITKQPQLKEWLQSYADHFKVTPRISFNSCVGTIRQEEDGTWTVNLLGGETKSYDFLVICTGNYSRPFIPKFKNIEEFQGKVIHSSHVEDQESLFKNKRVVVIGGGRSSQEISRLASDFSSNVINIKRKNPMMLDIHSSIWGKPIDELLFSRISSYFYPPFTKQDSGYIFKYCKILVYMYRKLILQGQKNFPEEMKMDVEAFREFPIYAVIADKKYVERVRSKSIRVIKGSVSEFSPDGIIVNGSKIKCDVVVLATGHMRQNFVLSENEDTDLWLYRCMIKPEVKNLAFVGSIDTFCMSTSVNLQAVWLCEMLRGKVKLPSQEEMRADIETRKQSFQKHFPGLNSKAHTWMIAVHLLDMLLRDMGLPLKRGRNMRDLWFKMVRSLDYKSVVTHRL